MRAGNERGLVIGVGVRGVESGSNVQTKRMRIQSLFMPETMSYSGLPDPGDGKGA